MSRARSDPASRRASRRRFDTSSLSAVSGVRSSCEATERKSSRTITASRSRSSALLLVVDVGRGGDPPDHRAVLVALGDGADQVPAKLSVAGAPEPHLPLERRFAAEAAFPVHAGLVAVVDVEDLPERPVGQLAASRPQYSSPARFQ